MRILITNDDGIGAPGLKALEHIATELAGPDGEVWTVAPAFEQSGVGHCISYTHPSMISELGPRRFATEGSPADCVLAALHVILGDQRPDLILSGVNRGNNSAENALYSGTLGAALEGALQGLPAMALSQYFGPQNAKLEDPFEAARTHGAGLIRQILDSAAPTHVPGDYRLFYNINFPPVPAAEVRGSRAVAQGYRREGQFGAQEQLSPNGRRYMWIKGQAQDASAPGTDAAANLEGYISITPMRADLTAHDALASLAHIV